MTKSTLIKTTLAGLVVGVLMLASTILAASPEQPEIVPTSKDSRCLSTVAVIEGEPLLTPDAGGVVYTAASCAAWATCHDNSMVDCSSSGSSGTCSFQDVDCKNEIDGHVECGGVKRSCPPCPDCSHLNYPGCTYFWNSDLECCDVEQPVGGPICFDPGCS